MTINQHPSEGAVGLHVEDALNRWDVPAPPTWLMTRSLVRMDEVADGSAAVFRRPAFAAGLALCLALGSVAGWVAPVTSVAASEEIEFTW